MNEKLLETIEQQLQLSVEEEVTRVRKAAHVPVPEDFEGECVDCGEPIPTGRLRTGAITCMECQSFKEKRAKTRKHNLRDE